MRKIEKSIKEMRLKGSTVFLCLFIFSFMYIVPCAFSQAEQTDTTTLKKSTPNIFIECETRDIDFIQKEITFVNHVKDQNEAQVYILITTQENESGGAEYILSFKGQKEFEGDDDVLKYQADKDVAEEVNKGLVDTIKMGLMRYVGKTPVSSRISIDFMDKVKPTSVVDKWNFWVFSISTNTFLNGEELFKSGMYFGSFSANRVTPELKIRLSVGAMYNENEFTFEDQIIKSSSDSQNFNGLIVKSINDHWSIGAYFSANSSKYTNIKLSLTPAPAIEYDLFPYSQSTKRQLRFLYRLGFNSVRYREETIYEKTYENLWKQSLSVTLELKQKWGTVNTSLEGSHYFHDFSKNRLMLWGGISLRLLKGLNFNMNVNYSRIHDQLSLARSSASLEEVLLRRKQLATTYNYYLSIGLSYTFGSIHSKVVNPRFGTGGRGISISF